MSYQNTTKAGVGIGAFGIFFSFLTTSLLILVPQYVLAPAARATYISTWSGLIMTIGELVLVYGLVFLSIAFAYYLTTKNYPPKSVMTGFVIGGLVLGFGDAFLGVTLMHFLVDDPAMGQSVVSHVADLVELSGRLVGGGITGILCAKIVERYF